MKFNDLIQSILQLATTTSGKNFNLLPSILVSRIISRNDTHPGLNRNVKLSFINMVPDDKLDDFLLGFFDLLNKQVKSKNYGIVEDLSAYRKIPILLDTGATFAGTITTKIFNMLEFFNGTDDYIRIINNDVVSKIINEFKEVEYKPSFRGTEEGSEFFRKLIAKLGQEVPDNLLLFMLDLPNVISNAEMSGKNDIEMLKDVISHIDKYKVSEYVDTNFINTITKLVDSENVVDANNFYRTNNWLEYIHGQRNIVKIYDEIIYKTFRPLVETLRTVITESYTFRDTSQFLRLLMDDEFTEILDTYKRKEGGTFLTRLEVAGIPVGKYKNVKEFSIDLLNNLRKGSKMYTTLNFDEWVKNPNFVTMLDKQVAALFHTFQDLTNEIQKTASLQAGNIQSINNSAEAILNSKYAEIFVGPNQTWLNPATEIRSFFGENFNIMQTQYSDANGAVQQLGLFDVNTLEFLEEASKLEDKHSNVINFYEPNVMGQEDVLTRLLNIARNQNVPVDNGFDIFSFAPPAGDIFHAGPSTRFLEELAKIPDLGEVDVWNWETGNWSKLTGRIQDDVWTIATQLIGDINNAPAELIKEATEKGIESPNRLIIKVNKPKNTTSQALFNINNQVAVPNQVNIGENLSDIAKNIDPDKAAEVIELIKNPKIGSAIASTALDFAKKAGKFVGGTTITALAPGDVAIELGLKRLLPKLGLAAISTPALAAYTAYELGLLAIDVGRGLGVAAANSGFGKAPSEVDMSSFGKDFWQGFTEDSVSDKYSIGYKLTKGIHNSLFENVYGRIAQDLYAGTNS